MMTTALTERHTIHEMTVAYREEVAKVLEAHRTLAASKARLTSVFGGSSYAFEVNPDRINNWPEKDKEAILKKNLKRSAWQVISQRLDVRRFMSTEQAKQLDSDLENVDRLPEVETEAFMGFLAGFVSRIDEFKTAAIKECFQMVRPWRINHVTNQKNAKYEVGKKIILEGWVSGQWGGGMRPNYHREQQFRILDNAFALMDGKGAIKSYCGELADSITVTTRIDKTNPEHIPSMNGETTYFKWKVFGNGNLHLEFKRLDLLQTLNEIGGAGMLRG